MDYSGRTLTYESDYYNAFAGIMRYFLQDYGLQYLWGVPMVSHIFHGYNIFLARALLWYHKAYGQSSENKPYRRMFSLNGSSEIANGHTIWFPSWSWIGWCGKIAYPDTSNCLGSFSLRDVRLEIAGRHEQTPLYEYLRWSIYGEEFAQPDAFLHLDVKVVETYEMSLDDGSFPPAITLNGCPTKWFLSEGLADSRALFEKLKSGKIELLELLTDYAANGGKGRRFFLVVENHTDYASRVGVAIVEGAFSIGGRKRVVRLR